MPVLVMLVRQWNQALRGQLYTIWAAYRCLNRAQYSSPAPNPYNSSGGWHCSCFNLHYYNDKKTNKILHLSTLYTCLLFPIHALEILILGLTGYLRRREHTRRRRKFSADVPKISQHQISEDVQTFSSFSLWMCFAKHDAVVILTFPLKKWSSKGSVPSFTK